jgi:hypothetical protein
MLIAIETEMYSRDLFEEDSTKVLYVEAGMYQPSLKLTKDLG